MKHFKSQSKRAKTKTTTTKKQEKRIIATQEQEKAPRNLNALALNGRHTLTFIISLN